MTEGKVILAYARIQGRCFCERERKRKTLDARSESGMTEGGVILA